MFHKHMCVKPLLVTGLVTATRTMELPFHSTFELLVTTQQELVLVSSATRLAAELLCGVEQLEEICNRLVVKNVGLSVVPSCAARTALPVL